MFNSQDFQNAVSKVPTEEVVGGALSILADVSKTEGRVIHVQLMSHHCEASSLELNKSDWFS